MRKLIAALVMIAAGIAPAIAQTSFSQLPAATLPLSGSEIVAGVQSGTTVKIPSYMTVAGIQLILGNTISASTLTAALSPASASTFGVAKCDNSTITCPGGIFSVTGAGTGNALFGTTTGNVANDVVCMSNTTVGVKDCGTALSALAPLASPTFSGTIGGSVTFSGTLTFSSANAYGTPSSITLTHGTGLPIAGLSGLGSGWSTALAATYSAPTGNAVFGTTSGNVIGDIVTLSNTTTGIQDSGTALTSLAPLASPTFTGTVSLSGGGGASPVTALSISPTYSGASSGFNNVSISPTVVLTAGSTFRDLYLIPNLESTTTTQANAVVGEQIYMQINNNNTQNWTNSTGNNALTATWDIQSSTAGTFTFMAGVKGTAAENDSGSATLTTTYGVEGVGGTSSGGTITNNVALGAVKVTGGTNNTYLLLSSTEADAPDTGNWDIDDKVAGKSKLGSMVLTAAAPTVAASQIGYGSTTAAASNCGSLSGSAGCIVVNIAGTTHYVPYW